LYLLYICGIFKNKSHGTRKSNKKTIDITESKYFVITDDGDGIRMSGEGFTQVELIGIFEYLKQDNLRMALNQR